MSPPEQRSGPRGVTAQGRQTAHQDAATASAASVQAAADEAAARDWYRLGFGAGWQVGYRYAYHEQDQADRRRMAYIHGLVRLPAYRDLERIRWDGRREDFGKPRPGDYPGMGADYQPAEYYVPLHPGGASPHRRERGAA